MKLTLIIFSICILGGGYSAQASSNVANTSQSIVSNTQDKVVQKESADDLIDYFFAAARLGDSEVISTFLDAGFPIDQVNPKSYTALMVAAYAGQLGVTEQLLQRGADACLQDKRGNTAIMGAIIKAEFRIVKTLYAHECEKSLTNKSGLTLAEFARYWGQTDKLSQMKAP